MIKKCAICNCEFSKLSNCSKKNWELRVTCSKKCSYIYKSQQMKGKMPKNIKQIAGMLKGMGKWFDCKGCRVKFQSRPELKHVKTLYCTRECWITNKVQTFAPRPSIRGELSHMWKGGVNTDRSRLRNTLEYKKWRHDVLKRDSHSCVNCGSKENIWVDHIKPFHTYPELRHEVDNGRTLCRHCDLLIGYQFFKENNPRKKETA